MGTRSGDIDAGVLEFLANKEGMDVKALLNMLNKKSGLLGLTEFSSDSRDVEDGYFENKENCVRAQKSFCYRVAKYIGAYVAAMNGVDAICFTAGVGENSSVTREMICEYLGYLGVTIDKEANKKRGDDNIISTADSKTVVCVIPTNEELAIARETARLVK